MCRAGNTASIHSGHLSWDGDALAILFGHMKNDHDGTRPRDARRVYANPFIPEICPVLSLAIYGAVLGLSNSKIFPGGNQKSWQMKDYLSLGIFTRGIRPTTSAISESSVWECGTDISIETACYLSNGMAIGSNKAHWGPTPRSFTCVYGEAVDPTATTLASGGRTRSDTPRADNHRAIALPKIPVNNRFACQSLAGA
ncbi:Hypothetical protein PHPALM_16601 [Phytophthora palmivora]|uniref:Uncharacterized protein n=1 Tax=Phytophthora palmivora TaxID=4796 RepID=A0A2P4XPI9_9STRA|nr:Hypothetical protein PHPALM_16601 [Phytophthora palmivora]